MKNHLQTGALATEYLKRTIAFTEHINPNLAQPYVGEQISEYLVDLMPKSLRESGRRITSELKRDGQYLDFDAVVEQCRQLVYEEQNAKLPDPVFVLTED